MAGTDLLLLLFKHSIVVMLLILILRAMKNASASKRVFAARCGLIALLITPVLCFFLPEIPVRLPYQISAILTPPASLPALDWLAPLPVDQVAFSVPAKAVELGRILLLAYLAGAAFNLLLMAWSLLRLRQLRINASHLENEEWQTALQQLSRQFGLQRKVSLLQSPEITSPLSWGWKNPVIALDLNSISQANPENILAHELAHIAKYDWLAIMVSRLLIVIYWWHPLMYQLHKTIAHDLECAADDAVLLTGALPSNYAQTLITVSRHAYATKAQGTLASNIADRGNPLKQRVTGLLDNHRSREPVSAKQWMLGTLLCTLMILSLGGMVIKGEHIVWPDQLLSASASNKNSSPERLLDELNIPNFTQLAVAMRAQNFNLRHASGGASFRQRAAIPALILGLQDQRPVVRQLAVWGLSEMRFPETTPAIAAMLRDSEAAVRAEAVGALGDIGETQWLNAMLNMLKDNDPRVRARAAHALGDLQEKASIPALKSALYDTDKDVAEQVQWALSELN